MKSHMTSLFLLLLLLLVIIIFGLITVKNYRNNYKAQSLLRIDPLETGTLNPGKSDADLSEAGIWMIGDSRIARWDEDLIAVSSKVANLGIEGQTSSQVYHRFKDYLEVSKPELIIIEVGINELKVIGLDKNLANSVTENYYRNIETMIGLCAEHEIKLILTNIFPVGKIELLRRVVWNSTVNESINAANNKLKSYCNNTRIYCFDAFSILSENGETVMPKYQSDFLHINSKGYEALSMELVKLINSIICVPE